MGNQSGDVIGIKVDNPMILLDRAYYHAPIPDFLGTTENEILGELTRHQLVESEFPLVKDLVMQTCHPAEVVNSE